MHRASRPCGPLLFLATLVLNASGPAAVQPPGLHTLLGPELTACLSESARARSETERKVATALHIALPQQRLHPAFCTLGRLLIGRGEGAAGKEGQGFRRLVLTALCGQVGYSLPPDFLARS